MDTANLMNLVPLRRRARRTERRFRQARMLARAFRHQHQPVAAHLIPVRRCNLSCTYCNEYDDHSSPVPTPDVLRRVDILADLGTGIVTMSGGEPLLHPDLDQILRHVRARGMIATVITNGYLLTGDRIERLNRAGLDHLQISIDNVLPDEVSKKSLKVLDHRLKWLAEYAEFDVTINAVVGGGVREPSDAVVIARRAQALGFSTTARNHPRPARPPAAARRPAAGDPGGGRPSRQVAVRFRQLQSVSEEPRERRAEPVAVPRRLSLSLRLRGWPGALVLAAARPSWHPSRAIWPGRSAS